MSTDEELGFYSVIGAIIGWCVLAGLGCGVLAARLLG